MTPREEVSEINCYYRAIARLSRHNCQIGQCSPDRSLKNRRCVESASCLCALQTSHPPLQKQNQTETDDQQTTTTRRQTDRQTNRHRTQDTATNGNNHLTVCASSCLALVGLVFDIVRLWWPPFLRGSLFLLVVVRVFGDDDDDLVVQ